MLKMQKSFKYFKQGNIGQTIFRVFNYLFLSIITIITLMPLINILSMSLSDNLAVAANEVKFWPIGFTLNSYEHSIKNVQFFTSFFTSVKRAALGISINMLIAILVAYPLSKSEHGFRSRKIYVWIFMITMVFNGGIVPLYMMVRYTHIYDTIWALIFPMSVNAFYILILMNFFRELPKEIEESAFLDGAGHLTILFKIYLPLSKAALATLTLFFFVDHWNSWFDGLIYIGNQRDYPLQTYLQSILAVPDMTGLTSEQRKSYAKLNIRSLKSAQIFITTVPILILYPFMQKYFTKGVVLGSVKG